MIHTTQKLVVEILKATGDFVAVVVKELGPGKGGFFAFLSLLAVLAFAAFLGMRLEDLCLKVLTEIMRAVAGALWPTPSGRASRNDLCRHRLPHN